MILILISKVNNDLLTFLGNHKSTIKYEQSNYELAKQDLDEDS